MKYVSLDIETTGLDKNLCQTLQIAAIVDDLITPIEELPRFVTFINWTGLHWEEFARSMHEKSGLLERYSQATKINFSHMEASLEIFLSTHYPTKEKRNIAGKNIAGFDIPFLKANSAFSPNIFDTFTHRVIDPGTSFTDFTKDKSVANLEICKKRAGIFSGPVTHDAEDDAIDVIKVIRQIAIRNRGI